MTETTALENGPTPAVRMGKAIMRGVIIGLPTGIVFLTLAIMLIPEVELAEAFATAILPGVLLGVFGGGFAGMAFTMEE